MKGTMRVMDRSGDTPTIWDTDPATRAEGEVAPDYVEREFDRLVNGGHLAFTVDEDFKTGDQIKAGEFDPEVHERVLVTPAFIGG
jgi:hypothetical protein